jgi:hypothetical protein
MDDVNVDNKFATRDGWNDCDYLWRECDDYYYYTNCLISVDVKMLNY